MNPSQVLRPTALAALCAVTALLCAAPAIAQPPDQGPGPSIGSVGPVPTSASACAEDPAGAAAAVREVFAELGGLYRNGLPGPAGDDLRHTRADTMARRHVDVQAFAVAVLRVAWVEANQEQRARWQSALGALLHQRYLERLEDPAGHRITVAGATVECDRAVVLAALEQVRSGHRLELALRLVYRDGTWRAWDVVVDDVSLMETWRSRFARFHRQGGLSEVDRQLRRMARHFAPSDGAKPRPL